MLDSSTGVAFGQHGEVIVGEDVFLSGAASQERTRRHSAGLEVLWVGVRCHPEIAAGREVAEVTG